MLRWVVNVLFVKSTTGASDVWVMPDLFRALQVPVGDSVGYITNNITNKY